MSSDAKLKLEYLAETKGLIREAIEAKGQTVADTDTFRSYAAKINSIEVSAAPVLESLEVTENGNYTPSAGTDGFSSVSVQVPDIPAVVQPLEVTENGTYTAPAGVDGYSPVTVNVAGSGTSPDLCYVTFMSYDGLTEYGKKAVAVGDDCADPIARGVFSTPTKESDAQYNYTFYGWANTPNGAADANWNKAITEDKTVYANFASAVRYYTITFYDEDGSTVLTTKSVAYGSVPSYTPTKDGYDFAGWTPTPLAVTGEASYTVVWKLKATFETATWAEIAEICAAGTHADSFSIGDTKPVTLTYDNGTSETINFTIVDMDVDPISTTEKAPLTIMAENIVSISPTKLASAYNKGKTLFYDNDTAKNFLARVFSALPSECQAVIKPLFYSEIFKSYTNVFVPHCVNLGISHTTWSSKADTPPYNAKYKHFANGASIKRTKLNDATYDDYWTSACCDYSSSSYTTAYFVAIDGTTYMSSKQNGASNSYGIVPCFCI